MEFGQPVALCFLHQILRKGKIFIVCEENHGIRKITCLPETCTSIEQSQSKKSYI